MTVRCWMEEEDDDGKILTIRCAVDAGPNLNRGCAIEKRTRQWKKERHRMLESVMEGWIGTSGRYSMPAACNT